jgi:diacylglycerol kinase (ATP)
MDSKEKKAFSLILRIESFRHAFRGIGIFLKNTHNAWVELIFGGVAIFLGFYFGISPSQWLVLVVSFGMLLMAEAFNTAMEVHMDLTSPDFHPYAKDTKDIAAGGVLIASIVFLVVTINIFIPLLRFNIYSL